jgi:hypothetical protein
VDGDGRVALRLEVGAPGLVGLVPVAAHGGVVPENAEARFRTNRRGSDSTAVLFLQFNNIILYSFCQHHT